MGSDRAIEFTDALLYEHTGQHLSDLQYCILQHPSKTYRAIATLAGYSEGHVKDVAAQLWRVLSEALGERITKGNYRSRLKYWLKRAKHKVVTKLVSPSAHVFPRQDVQVAERPPSPVPTLPYFLGRQSACATLDALRAQHRLIVIQGEGGLGKTTLAQTYLHGLGCGRVLELMMAKETANISPVERVVEEWLRQDFEEEPGLDFGVTLDRLRRRLRQEPVGILIDNFEPVLDANGQLVAEHRRYVELLRVLADPAAQSITLLTSRDRICEPGIRAYHYRLPGLSLATWQAFFTGQGVAEGSDSTQLATLHRTYGGNAKAMEILCSTVQSDYAGDLVSYGQVNYGGQVNVGVVNCADTLVETDLKNLINSQVNRLQQLDPFAYRLLCRLSCYRFQTVAQLPLAAVTSQLPAVPAAQHHQAVVSLRNRSLLETHKGSYWLHPAVRAVVIERLSDDEWQTANRAAARFWLSQRQQITTVQAALEALEAYYHYRSIDDAPAAASVLLHSYYNQWQQHLPLASHLYRMGLLQPIVEAMGEVLPRLQASAQTSELYNILGDVHWIKGEIVAAIACQQRTLATTETLLAAEPESNALTAIFPPDQPFEERARRRYYLKMLNVDSQLSMGFYRLDLWELTAAKAQFEQVVRLAQGTEHQAWADKAEIAIALVNAHLGNYAAAKTDADRLQDQLTQQLQTERSGRFAYFIHLLGHTYNRLNELETAQSLYQTAIAFADVGHYLQIKAKTLTGLGEVARKQARFTEAVDYHQRAIAILEQVGARCDLAEAHFQLALTIRACGPSIQSPAATARSHADTAMRLFTDINAPVQVAKVKQHLLAG